MTTMQTPDGFVDFSVQPATPESGSSITIQLNLRLPSGIFVHPKSERFYRILGELALLHIRKSRDYGTEEDSFANIRGSKEWGVEPWVGAMIRATDKVLRLQKFAREGRLANEAVEDSFRDLAVYAVIALVLYEEGAS